MSYGPTPLPRSWWHQYSEALCNSRGYKTEWQVTRERLDLHLRIKRHLEEAWFKAHTTFLATGERR